MKTNSLAAAKEELGAMIDPLVIILGTFCVVFTLFAFRELL